MVWCFVGHSNRTAVSVNKQFLNAVRSHDIVPQLIRSDKDTETTLLCNSQLVLHRAVNPEISIREVYSYGTSTKNQRIESWWNLLANAQTDTWREIFNDLELEGYFDGGAQDIIAMQFIYMDMITQHIHTFVQIHNSHRIRRQRKRDHYLPAGKPVELYNYPPTGIIDYGLSPNKAVLDALDTQMSSYNLDEYLTSDTRILCEEMLTNGGFPIAYSFSEQHREAYLYLRTGLTCYIGLITVLPTPIGTERWIEECMASNKTDQETIRYLNETTGKEWDILDNKFALSGEMVEFDETKVIDYDGMCSSDDDECDDDRMILNIFS